jgi:bifunctional non-homologous end joining protein LigD
MSTGHVSGQSAALPHQIDLRQNRIEDRRKVLNQLVACVEVVLFSEAFKADGALVFAKVCEMGLEGIVSKQAGSPYRSRNGRQWFKCKNPTFMRT